MYCKYFVCYAFYVGKYCTYCRGLSSLQLFFNQVFFLDLEPFARYRAERAKRCHHPVAAKFQLPLGNRLQRTFFLPGFRNQKSRLS